MIVPSKIGCWCDDLWETVPARPVYDVFVENGTLRKEPAGVEARLSHPEGLVYRI